MSRPERGAAEGPERGAGTIDSRETRTGHVLEIVAGVYRVELDGETVPCVLRGRAKRGDHSVAVGDRVAVERLSDGTWRIEKRLPRASQLARAAPSGRRQVIVANIDQVAVVVSVARPSPDLRTLDRLLALAHVNDLSCLVIANKVDLLDGSGASGGREAFGNYHEAGYPVIATSALTGVGLDELRRALEGRVTVLAGASGVGKSSLLNALVPGLNLRIGAVGERSGRGRHTTVSARLIRFPGGGFIADTPGIQYIGLGDLSPAQLAAAFPEFAPHAADCRFHNCRHAVEPDCAVRAAAEGGDVSAERYERYRTLLDEIAAGG
ncbi:MAG: ribosome small subunit-dependent GTPase A [Gemmatimonadota bacterium]